MSHRLDEERDDRIRHRLWMFGAMVCTAAMAAVLVIASSISRATLKRESPRLSAISDFVRRPTK